MLGRVVKDVAALAERSEIVRSVVVRTLAQVRAHKENSCDPKSCGGIDAHEPVLHLRQLIRARQAANPPAFPAAPGCHVAVPPDSIAQVQHVAAWGRDNARNDSCHDGLTCCYRLEWISKQNRLAFPAV